MSWLAGLVSWLSGARLGSRIVVRRDSDGAYWAAVTDLPGCFASGRTLPELTEALAEAVAMCATDKPRPSRLTSAAK